MGRLELLNTESKLLSEKIFEHYSNKNFYFSGTVSHDGFDYNNHFEGYISKDGSFKMEWFSDDQFKNGGIVFGNDSKGTLISRHYSPKTGLITERDKEEETEMVIAGATGISSGSAHLIRAIQLKDYNAIFPESVEGIDIINGVTIIEGWGHKKTHRKKLEIKDNQITKITCTSYPGRIEFESLDTSDEKIIADLQADGDEITQEAIENLRNIYEQCNERQNSFGYDDFRVSYTEITQQYEIDSFEINEEFKLWK